MSKLIYLEINLGMENDMIIKKEFFKNLKNLIYLKLNLSHNKTVLNEEIFGNLENLIHLNLNLC